MLSYVEGDLFGSPAQVIVNTVNTVGVMGKGIALEFKKRYPDMFEYYKKVCDKHNLVIGKLMLYYAPDHWLLLFPTKEHWRNPSKLEYIEKGLMTFVRKYADYNITSIAFPKLGCGNGELNWDDVKPLMEKYLKDLPIDVYIYQGMARKTILEHKKQDEMSEWMKENAKDLSFTGIKDEIIMHTLITPIELEYGVEKWNAFWYRNGKLSFECENEKIEMEETELQEIWDYVCAKRIFVNTKQKEKDLFFLLLMSMGYMQEISVKDEKADIMIPGYQLEMGKGRMFWLRGSD